jgi:drug/metabolite transporter (DMT)-like permease
MSAPSSPTARLATLGLLLVLATAVISGCSTYLNSFAVQGTNSDAFVTVRNVAVAAMLAPIALVVSRRASVPLRRTDVGWLAVVGLVGGAIPFLLFFHGLELATAAGGAATASFVYRTLFLMAAVFGVVFLGERFHRNVVAAAVLLLAGNLLLLSLISPLWTPGTSYVFVATVLWAGEYTLSKHLLGRLPSTTVGFGRMGFGALFLLGYLALTSQYGAVVSMTGGQWIWVGISAALLAAFVLSWYAGLRTTDLAVATSVLVLGFPVTWALSVATHAARFTVLDAVGAGAIVAGVIVVAGARRWSDLASVLRSAIPRRVAG